MANPPDRRALRQSASWFYLAAAAVIGGAIVATIAYLGPFPPRVVVMTTGAPGGAYDELARRYQAILARSHVELSFTRSRNGC